MGTLFELEKDKRIRQRKERDGFCLLSAVSKIQCDSDPTAPTAVRLWKTFTFFLLFFDEQNTMF